MSTFLSIPQYAIMRESNHAILNNHYLLCNPPKSIKLYASIASAEDDILYLIRTLRRAYDDLVIIPVNVSFKLNNSKQGALT